MLFVLLVRAAVGLVWKGGQDFSTISKPALRAIPVQVAIVSIGGLLVSTFLTLFFVPIIYMFFEEVKEKLFNRFRSESVAISKPDSTSN